MSDKKIKAEAHEDETFTLSENDCKIILKVFSNWFKNSKLIGEEKEVWEELYTVVKSNAEGKPIEFDMIELTDIYTMLDAMDAEDKDLNKKINDIKKDIWNTLDKDSKMWILHNSK